MNDLVRDVEALRQWASLRQDARQQLAICERNIALLKAVGNELGRAGMAEGSVWDAVSNLEFRVQQLEEALARSASPPGYDPMRAA